LVVPGQHSLDVAAQRVAVAAGIDEPRGQRGLT
jgi:hypothetical protein